MVEIITPIFIVLIALLGAAVPSFIWLSLFLKKDLHPEPKQLILYTFGAGALISLVVVVLQYFFKYLVIGETGSLVLSIFVLAFIEEVFKFLAAYKAVSKDPAFDEAVDAMIYMVAAALGFASVENLFIFAGSVSAISVSALGDVWNTFVLRFLGATLLHSVSSALIGFYWARGKLREKKLFYVTLGIIFATVIHGLFNYLLLQFHGVEAIIYPAILLLTGLFVAFLNFERLEGRFFKKRSSRDTNL